LTGTRIKPISIERNFFEISGNHNWKEKLAVKGFQALQVFPDFFVVNTQVYAPEKLSEIKIASLQFKKIQEFSLGKKVVLSGDLNLDEHDFLNLNETFFYKSPLVYTVAKKNKYADSRFNLSHHADKIIDYIVSNKKKMKVETHVMNPVEVSDHYPLIGKFKI
jgi:endonuclease/exonuclease/phosphatase (EEP) superfamily protein YafD